MLESDIIQHPSTLLFDPLVHSDKTIEIRIWEKQNYYAMTPAECALLIEKLSHCLQEVMVR